MHRESTKAFSEKLTVEATTAQSPVGPSRNYRTSRAPTQGQKAIPKPATILLSDDEDDKDLSSRSQGKENLGEGDLTRTEPTFDDEDIPSDEEFPELVRKARERTRLRKLEEQSQPEEQSASTSFDEPTVDKTQLQSKPIPRLEPDSKISVLLTPNIPNTNPLLVQIRLQQHLKDVRVAWCKKQGMDDETAETVFITWKAIRLHDVTTCKSLGLDVDQDGNVVRHGKKQSLTEEERQVHMETWTEEIWAERRREKERAQRAGADEDSAERSSGGSGPTGEEPGEKIHIVLKSKGYADHKLVVRPVRPPLSSILEMIYG